ncbi:MAG: cyanophycin synthetase [Burkholderiales bacterium]|jgi:cyanophycin synthetase|nr:cyanophycin synthetase [Burkholderiales bacterium]
MEVARIRALRGPNLWNRRTAIEALVSCAPDETVIADVPALETKLHSRFPSMGSLTPAGDKAAVSLAHALERVALSLQAEAGCPVTFSQTVSTTTPGLFQVVVEYTEEEVGRLALLFAQELCTAAQQDAPFDLAGALAQMQALDEDIRLGPSTGAIVNAAVARRIPYRRLTQGSLVQFGWGSRQRRIQAAEVDRTSSVAEAIAHDKELTKKLLAAAAVPVPEGRPVTDAEDAWVAANEIGLPVVVKPLNGSQGRGVTVNINSREHLLAAYEAAVKIRRQVMVERYLPGPDFRLLVVGNKLVAAARRDPPQLIGDGVHSVRELVDVVNRDPRRSEGHATALTKIRFDDIANTLLAMQGHTADSVPPPGTRVILRNNANLSTGGAATDVTDEVHPDIAAHAVAAAQTVGIDIAGIDVVCETILKPLEEQYGGVVEVNAAPGLRMHLSPSYGKGRPLGEAIINHMFPPNENARIPVVAVTGTNGKTTTVRLIAHLFDQHGWRVGMTTTDGIYVNHRRIDNGDCSGPRSARSVLMHPDVDAAVFETARGGMLREGLGFDRCRVAVVTNLGIGDHLGLDFITSVEDLAVLKRVVVQNVEEDGMAVLNADDPLVAAMAAACPGDITFFARDGHSPRLMAHRAQGKRVVYLSNHALVAAQGGFEYRLPLADIPLTHNGTVPFQVDNAMAAIAAAWAIALPWETIARGLASFVSDDHAVPGRFNVFDYRGATLIADYGHNPDAIAALTQAIEAMPARRRFVIISGAGDRRDEDLQRQTQILGDVFDEVILYQDQCQRGRQDGEVLALLRRGLAHAQRTQIIEEIHGESLAIDTALKRLSAGDLCLVLVDQVEAALAHIRRRIEESEALLVPG